MYLITNRHLCDENHYLKVIDEAVDNGVKNIILREKDMKDEDLITLYNKIVKKTNWTKEKFNLIINSNLNLYENLDFSGIHLPFKRFLELIDKGYYFDKNKILGLSLHEIKEVELLNQIIRNKDINVDYITLSHIYQTKCKENLKPKGLMLLEESKKVTDIRIVALGGILPSNVKEVLRYSNDFAVMSTLFNCESIKSKIEEYEIK
ncbi:MAG: thiamine phosphate synthase [Terrisporobacter sp.]|uniref:thiamine phosphate synthase n=1 Tax=Terrisporobacter sp. TaxID=1965305 RepID=UPI002FCBC097